MPPCETVFWSSQNVICIRRFSKHLKGWPSLTLHTGYKIMEHFSRITSNTTFLNCSEVFQIPEKKVSNLSWKHKHISLSACPVQESFFIGRCCIPNPARICQSVRARPKHRYKISFVLSTSVHFSQKCKFQSCYHEIQLIFLVHQPS